MKGLFTTEAMRTLDRRAIQEMGIPGVVLMEHAGAGVARRAKALVSNRPGGRVLLLCGKGNNGGDGFVAARHLVNRGYAVDVRLVGDPARIQGDARVHADILTRMGISVTPLRAVEELDRLPPVDLIVDALLGTGISGAVTGLLAEVIGWINGRDPSRTAVLSVDLPSGLDADTGRFEGACVQADETATMAALKQGLFFYPGRANAGRISLVDIGMPAALIDTFPVTSYLLENADVQAALPYRPPWGHKGTFGKVLVLAGSRGMTGAAALCAQSVLRAGAGLVRLGIPESLNPILESLAPEVITHPLKETEAVSLSLAAWEDISSLLTWADVLILGPGLSCHPETMTLVEKIVREASLPLVLDADGLNALAGKSRLLTERRAPTVITPHPGELSRLVGRPIETIVRDPIATAREVALQHGCACALKGAPSVIASQEGRTVVNPTGNAGMGTAGVGDVLTGIIGGLLAQGAGPFEAAFSAVYVHGLAGDLVAKRLGGRSLVAGDILASLGDAFVAIEWGNRVIDAPFEEQAP